ncbi:hypothetical protein OG533_30815 [Streptomyces sp. NBC_01186]|uniref:hypothetical protein n=1 Tax=unclassified Streptomyces TaxID=2593676 RepID=UPI002DD9E42A|nr:MULTISPECIES: hypothetical protein [unclassified Streptomyces]WSB75936.1 hypothetical protein OHB04_09125 [Streptomyces sp. NBC_01775]WSS15788.1 hypothetical protein OG533_30815 [Streptomyces sp. NBC_01186]
MTAAASPPTTETSNAMPHTDETTDPHERPPHRPRHRGTVLLIVVLLIALPGGYLVQSAFQSRDSGKDKERAAAASSLTYARPPKASQRIYNLQVPLAATRVAFYEENSWSKSTMWLEFRTTKKRLAEFMKDLGSSGKSLHKGKIAISGKQAREVGWRFEEPGHRYWGLIHHESGNKPDTAIVVDKTYKKRPHVYAVSTAKF